MNLITPLSLFIFTFKLGSTFPVNDDKLNPLVDDEYPMVIRNDRISGHSGRMRMMMMTYSDDNKSLDDEIQVTTTSSPSQPQPATTVIISNQDEIQLTSTESSLITIGTDGDFKLGQSPINFTDNVKPNQYHNQLPDNLNDNLTNDQSLSPLNVTNQVINDLESSSKSIEVNEINNQNVSPSTTVSSTINQITSKINLPSSSSAETSDLPEINLSTTTTTQSTTTTTQSFQDKVNSLIEDSFAQTTKLLIDLEEQIKLNQFSQQTEPNLLPLNIFTSAHGLASSSSSSSPSIPLAYALKLSTSNFLFRPLIRGSSIVSGSVNFHHNDDLKSLTDPDNLNLGSVNYETIDENGNPDNPNSIINHNNPHWYGNQKQSGIQMQSMIDEVTRIEQNVEVLISELVSNRRYVTAAVFRSLLNYLRRLRISLERLQSRMAIIGVGNSPQGSSLGGSISSGISSSVSSIASSVSSTFLPEQASGPLGGSSGGFNPITSGSAIASTYIESIRVRMNRITEEIRTLITRMRSSFSSTSSSSSSSPTLSSSLSPLPSLDQFPPLKTTTTTTTTTTKSPLASSSSILGSSSRKSIYYFK
ncbi:uncharacterized protein LOC128390900 [Panonychus citri]|uniref:uncharacterized protein LOC128390900 n=1 Tax=Panonychus citri TaxID=50023 RepID=UPI0023075D8B|nr:uncharacterized protein LOC128390900 [Panonychus citri]